MSTWKLHLAAGLLAGALMGALGAGQAVAQNEADSLSASFRKVSQKVLPAVVTVVREGSSTSGAGFRSSTGSTAPEFDRAPFDVFEPGTRSPLQDMGGSGVVINAEKGLVLTNEHVVQGAPALTVILADGRHRSVKQIRHDPATDLAILTIEPGNLHEAAWGDSSAIEIGDWVLAIGQPFGLSGTVTAGIISNKGREVPGASIHQDLLQTDAAINPGNSGGPLVNLKGEIVGINTALKGLGNGSSGLGFAIPASRARRVANDLVEFGRVRRAFLGVQIRPADQATADALGRPGAVIISAVSPGSPAAEAGLQPEDAIVKLNGQSVTGPGMLRAMIELATIGEPLRVTVIRDGQNKELTAKPQAAPEPGGPPPQPITPAGRGPQASAAPGSYPPSAPAATAPPALVSTPASASPAAPVTPTTPASAPPAAAGPGPFAPAVAATPSDPQVLSPAPDRNAPPPPPPLPPPAARQGLLEARNPGRLPELGLRVIQNSLDLAQRYGLGDRTSEGVVVLGVEPDSQSDRAGLEVGMLITDVGNQKVIGLPEFRAAVSKRPGAQGLVLHIRKGQHSGFRVLLDQAAHEDPTATEAPAPRRVVTSTPTPASTTPAATPALPAAPEAPAPAEPTTEPKGTPH